MGKLLKFKRTRKVKAKTRTKAKPTPQIDMAMQFALALRGMVTDEEAEAFRLSFDKD